MSHFGSHSLKEIPAVLILSEKLVMASVITKRGFNLPGVVSRCLLFYALLYRKTFINIAFFACKICITFIYSVLR